MHTSTKPYVRLDAVLHAESADEANDARFRKTDRQFQYLIYKDNNEWSDFGLVDSKNRYSSIFIATKPTCCASKITAIFTYRSIPCYISIWA
ncbi:MAG: hypothetical protein IPL33_21785 [Sphingobacteriales bacterium]|nr:hypothetical protein [Sphingobacteriales bacterium]